MTVHYRKVAALVPMSHELLDEVPRLPQWRCIDGRVVVWNLSRTDPNPFPRIRLFRIRLFRHPKETS